MNKQRRIQLFVITLGLVFLLSACNNGSTSMYDSPIGVEGGWGWLQWIIGYVADFTFWVSNVTGGSYWVGLVIVTLIIRTLGWPIYAKSNAMTMNMQAAQPELNRIQEKYKGKTDEVSQKKQQQETLAVYKEYNVNPLGCLLPFLQMPIFIAMYQVVRRMPLSNGIAEGARDYSSLSYTFLGIDLKSGIVWSEGLGVFPEIILPILVGVLMFLYQRYSMKKPDYLQNKKYQTEQALKSQNQMKYMSYFMVFMLVSIAVTNNGIALYWVVGNAFQFLQTYITRQHSYKKHMEREKEQKVIL